MTADSHWLQVQAELNPGKTALVSRDKVYSFNALNEKVNRISAFLLQRGFKASQIVPLIFNHGIQFVEALFAVWRIGAVPFPLSVKISREELYRVQSLLDHKIYLTDKKFSFNSEEAVTLDTESCSSSAKITGLPAREIENTALMILTSGTTSAPKIVELSFSNLYYSYKSINEFDNYSSNDKFLASLPFNHIGGFMNIVRALLSGSTLCVPAGYDYFSIAEGMKYFNPSIISLVPTNLYRLTKNAIAPNSALRSVYLGGAPSDAASIKAAIELSYPIVKVYGSSETSAMISAYKLDRRTENISASGYSLTGNRIYILNNGIRIKAGMEGEIAVESKSLFKGYYKNPEYTAQRKSGSIFFTGDYGFIDEQGLLNFTARSDEFINSGGEKINPREIETALNKLDVISDSYVFAVKDKQWGNKIIAAVVMRENEEFNPDRITGELKQTLSYYKIPKHFIELNTLPRNELGEIDKEAVMKSVKLKNF